MSQQERTGRGAISQSLIGQLGSLPRDESRKNRDHEDLFTVMKSGLSTTKGRRRKGKGKGNADRWGPAGREKRRKGWRGACPSWAVLQHTGPVAQDGQWAEEERWGGGWRGLVAQAGHWAEGEEARPSGQKAHEKVFFFFYSFLFFFCFFFISKPFQKQI